MTCGNRDNYNVSVRFRRVAGAGGGSRNNETSFSSKGPPGGNSTLMLAPLPGNHPQSVFQSVSLLFNYPFKPYNLLLRGTAAMILTRAPLATPRRERQRRRQTRFREGESVCEIQVENGSRVDENQRRRNVGSRVYEQRSTGLPRRRYVDIGGLGTSERDKDGWQLCCETAVSRPWLRDTSSFSQG